MLTHILYAVYPTGNTYFSGVFEDRHDNEGIYGHIEWEWCYNRENATMLTCPDAWNLLGFARKQFPTLTIEVARCFTLGDIQRMTT